MSQFTDSCLLIIKPTKYFAQCIFLFNEKQFHANVKIKKFGSLFNHQWQENAFLFTAQH